MASSYQFKVLAHSPDRQRVVVWLTRNDRTDKYMVAAGTRSLVWTRTRGRSYIVTADKCNCPASRGRCKHALVTADLKAAGFFPAERWVTVGGPAVKPFPAGVKVIDCVSPTYHDLPAGVAVGFGWMDELKRTVAVVPADYPTPRGWATTTNGKVLEFARNLPAVEVSA